MDIRPEYPQTPFQRAVEDLISDLSPHERSIFNMKCNNLDTMVQRVSALNETHSRGDMRRYASKLKAIKEHLSGFFDFIRKATSEAPPYVQLAWGAFTVFLEIAATYSTRCAKLTEILHDLSEQEADVVVRYTKMGFKNWERVAKVVTDIYCGILRFLLFVYRLFKSKDGKDRGMVSIRIWRSEGRLDEIRTSLYQNNARLNQEVDLAWKLNQRIDSFMSRLETFNMPSYHDDLSKLNRRDTRAFIQKFNQWIDDFSGTPILWARGETGCGKTTFCHSAIVNLKNRLERTELGNFVCAFFYINKSEERLVSSSVIMRSILHQLLFQAYDTIPDSEKICNFLPEGGPAPHVPDKEGLRNIAIAIVDLLPQTYILIDGADHLPNEALLDILRFIHDLTCRSKKCRAAVFSCDGQDFRNTFALYATIIECSTFARPQIAEYLKCQLRRKLESSLTAEQEKWITDNVKGSFLTVERVLDILRRGSSQENMQRRLNSIKPLENINGASEQLEYLYRESLNKIDRYSSFSERQRALTVLKWVLLAACPLTLAELSDAVTASEITDNDQWPTKPRMTTRDLHSLCVRLCVIHKGKVVFHHDTVGDYYIQNETSKGGGPASFRKAGHSSLYVACLRYQRLHTGGPLASYVYWHSLHHKRQAGNGIDAEDDMPFPGGYAFHGPGQSCVLKSRGNGSENADYSRQISESSGESSVAAWFVPRATANRGDVSFGQQNTTNRARDLLFATSPTSPHFHEPVSPTLWSSPPRPGRLDRARKAASIMGAARFWQPKSLAQTIRPVSMPPITVEESPPSLRRFSAALEHPQNPLAHRWFFALDSDYSHNLIISELEGAFMNLNGSPNPESFDTETVSILGKQFDTEKRGQLNLQEFTMLFDFVAACGSTFRKFDRDHNGLLDSGELLVAIEDQGFQISRIDPTMNLFLGRYGAEIPHNTEGSQVGIKLDRFARSLVALQVIKNKFKKDADKDGFIRLTQEQLLHTFLQLPP